MPIVTTLLAKWLNLIFYQISKFFIKYYIPRAGANHRIGRTTTFAVIILSPYHNAGDSATIYNECPNVFLGTPHGNYTTNDFQQA